MLAPMEGVGHPAFRALVAEHGGIGVVCTEFVRVSRAPLSASALVREVVKVPGVPLSVQVMGNDADKMAEAAAVVAEAGADVVDVNLGCPMPRVVRKGVGAAMLKDLPLLYRVLSSMRARTPGLLSAKIRAGFDDRAHVLDIARVVVDAGCDFLVIHPRRRCDFYAGVADWRSIALVRSAVPIPVVGNGDVWSADDALRMRRETGCDAVMIGRPAIRNPWIFRQIAELEAGTPVFVPTGADLVTHLERTRSAYRDAYGGTDAAILGKLKELVKYLLRALPGHEAYVRELLPAPTVDTLLAGFASRFAPLGAEALDLGPSLRLGTERSGSALVDYEAA